jgi:hypothetical protein
MLHCLYTYVARVCFKCFTCFRCMLQQVLHVASVFISRPGKRAHAECFIWILRMLQWLYMYVSNVSAVFKRMLQMFYLNVAYVAVVIHICCKRMFQMFYLFIAASASCCKCFY